MNLATYTALTSGTTTILRALSGSPDGCQMVAMLPCDVGGAENLRRDVESLKRAGQVRETDRSGHMIEITGAGREVLEAIDALA